VLDRKTLDCVFEVNIGFLLCDFPTECLMKNASSLLDTDLGLVTLYFTSYGSDKMMPGFSMHET
jgi:hypothetical protein